MTFLAAIAVLALAVAQASFQPGRFVASGQFELDAPVSKAFPMFEPLGEKAWAQGWNPQPIYPVDIKPEVGTVFQTEGSKGIPSTWIMTRYEHDQTVEYSVFTPGHDTTQIVVTCHSLSPNKTEVHVTYCITGLSVKGNEFGQSHKYHFAEIMEHWRIHVSGALGKQ
jgi:hypothetical protein